MREVRIVTVPLDPRTGLFDHGTLRGYLADREVLRAEPHFFSHDGSVRCAVYLDTRVLQGATPRPELLPLAHPAAGPATPPTAALTWCASNTPALPGTGWRLPTSHELEDLADTQTKSPAIDAVFAGTPSTSSEWFWSSTPWPWVPLTAAWVVNFGYGVSSYYGETSNTFRARCVR